MTSVGKGHDRFEPQRSQRNAEDDCTERSQTACNGLILKELWGVVGKWNDGFEPQRTQRSAEDGCTKSRKQFSTD